MVSSWASELSNDVEFVVQVNGWHVDTGRADAFESFAAARDDVHLVRGFLKEQAYYELVADADVVLLPYQDSVYISGTSAVFEEAMYLGRPVEQGDKALIFERPHHPYTTALQAATPRGSEEPHV